MQSQKNKLQKTQHKNNINIDEKIDKMLKTKRKRQENRKLSIMKDYVSLKHFSYFQLLKKCIFNYIFGGADVEAFFCDSVSLAVQLSTRNFGTQPDKHRGVQLATVLVRRCQIKSLRRIMLGRGRGGGEEEGRKTQGKFSTMHTSLRPYATSKLLSVKVLLRIKEIRTKHEH